MKKYLVSFDYRDNGEIIKSENDNNAQEMIEVAMVRKINKGEMLGIYNENYVHEMMGDDQVDYTDYEKADTWLADHNILYFDLSEYAELESKAAQWIYYLNMDYATIREVE